MGRKSREDREATMLEVAKLDARGRTQVYIATFLGLSQSTVCNYLKSMRATDLELAVDEVKRRREKLLKELDEIKRESWEAWENSKTEEAVSLDGERYTVAANPDPRYLQTVRQAIEDERTLLGLDEPKRVDDGDAPFDWTRLAELMPRTMPADDVEADITGPLRVVDTNDSPTIPNGFTSNGDAHHGNGSHHPSGPGADRD